MPRKDSYAIDPRVILSRLYIYKPGRSNLVNCQVLHYTRRDPETGELAAHLNWMRSVCPNEPANSLSGWHAIERKTFSDQQLLAAAQSIPRLFDE